MTPAQIVQADKERLASDAKAESQPTIKLKNPVMIATKSDLA